MDIRIIKEPVGLDTVAEIAKEFYGEMIKGVADIEREIIALGGEWHRDAREVLLKDGSSKENTWGFRFYLDRPKESDIEYVSHINIRPTEGNHDIYIEDPGIRERVKDLVDKLILK